MGKVSLDSLKMLYVRWERWFYGQVVCGLEFGDYRSCMHKMKKL